MVQLARIEAAVKWRWGLKENLQSNNEKDKEEDRDDEERSEEEPRKSQEEIEEGTLLSTSCQCNSFVFYYFGFIFLDCCVYTV